VFFRGGKKLNKIQLIECMDCSFCQKFKNLNKWAIADSFAYMCVREMNIYEDRLAIKLCRCECSRIIGFVFICICHFVNTYIMFLISVTFCILHQI
jgi:hypothetical protein